MRAEPGEVNRRGRLTAGLDSADENPAGVLSPSPGLAREGLPRVPRVSLDNNPAGVASDALQPMDTTPPGLTPHTGANPG
jgi:hypothetical protein